MKSSSPTWPELTEEIAAETELMNYFREFDPNLYNKLYGKDQGYFVRASQQPEVIMRKPQAPKEDKKDKLPLLKATTTSHSKCCNCFGLFKPSKKESSIFVTPYSSDSSEPTSDNELKNDKL